MDIISSINKNINNKELEITNQFLNNNLSFENKIIGIFNDKKENIQIRIFPFINKQISFFGDSVLDIIIQNPSLYMGGISNEQKKLLFEKIKNNISCPNKTGILKVINQRNNLAFEIKNIYQDITNINKTIEGFNSIINAFQIGVNFIKNIPYPATGIPPLGLPPLTTGIIEIVGSSVDELQKRLTVGGLVLTSLNITAATFGLLLGVVLNLISILDDLIQICSENKEIPFEQINIEINTDNNQSQEIFQTQNNLIYKGFKLELQFDMNNKTQYLKRYARALNKQGIPVLKTESSFASNPQILLDQLKFIIDSDPNLTSE